MVKSQSNDIISIENVSKSFGGHLVLDNCSLKVRRNNITAIVGPNGSGKTTLFNVICGSIKPDSGDIYLDEKNIKTLSVNRISNMGVSRIFQQSSFFPNLSIAQNLLLAIDDEDTKFVKNIICAEPLKDKEKIITDTLRLLGIKVNLEHLPHELSFGQQRIIEIARSLIKPHKIIIMDEPVSGLSPAMKKNMKNLFLQLKKNKETLFLAEHDINFVNKIADRIVLIDKGRIILDTTPKKIKNKSLFAKIYLGE